VPLNAIFGRSRTDIFAYTTIANKSNMNCDWSDWMFIYILYPDCCIWYSTSIISPMLWYQKWLFWCTHFPLRLQIKQQSVLFWLAGHIASSLIFWRAMRRNSRLLVYVPLILFHHQVLTVLLRLFDPGHLQQQCAW